MRKSQGNLLQCYNPTRMRHGLLLIGLTLVVTACTVEVGPLPSPLPALLPLPSATPRPAIRPAAPLPTPIIIASPTPTATPVTHVVQAGETLIGIAVKYGVSLEALQAANNNVPPQFLSIGAILIIPAAEGGTGADLSSWPAVTPAAVEVGDPACYPLPTGAVYCFVEARNPGVTALENVSARITLAGADGLPFASAIASSALDVIPAGAAAPMAVLFPSVPEAIAAAGVQVLTAEAVADLNAGAVPFEIVRHQGTAEGTQWTATGQVRNPSTRRAASGWLTLTLYDGAGAILGYRKQPLANGLAVSETQAFAISAASLGGPVARYVVAAEGRP